MERKIELYNFLKNMFEIKQANVNPLPVLPESKLKLYCVQDAFDSEFFDTTDEQELCMKMKKTDVKRKITIEYLGEVAGKNNVIKEIKINGDYRLISIKNENEYDVYNVEKSNYKGDFVWDHYYGNTKSVYNAFKERNIILVENKQKVISM